jgi:hypothetical protein
MCLFYNSTYLLALFILPVEWRSGKNQEYFFKIKFNIFLIILAIGYLFDFLVKIQFFEIFKLLI